MFKMYALLSQLHDTRYVKMCGQRGPLENAKVILGIGSAPPQKCHDQSYCRGVAPGRT